MSPEDTYTLSLGVNQGKDSELPQKASATSSKHEEPHSPAMKMAH